VKKKKKDVSSWQLILIKYGSWQSVSALFCFAFLFMDVA
jgi:hypothetical protein